MTAFANHAPPITYQTKIIRIQHTYARLTWLHGSDRAHRIVNGQDDATQADIAAWRKFGASA